MAVAADAVRNDPPASREPLELLGREEPALLIEVEAEWSGGDRDVGYRPTRDPVRSDGERVDPVGGELRDQEDGARRSVLSAGMCEGVR